MATNTSFGFSSFGISPFGASLASGSILINTSVEIKQVALWVSQGSELFKCLIDIGGTFYGSQALGTVTQVPNFVAIQFQRECEVLAVYLFDTDDDLSYLNHLEEWDAASVYRQINGAARHNDSWRDGLSVAVERGQEDTLNEITTDSFGIEMHQLEDVIRSQPLLAKASGKGVGLQVQSSVEVEELDNVS